MTSNGTGDDRTFPAKRRVDLHGVEYAYVDEGDGPPVLMLHGFPDTSYMWRHQIRALSAAGFRVIAPDLRGFGDSGKPTGVAEYDMLKVLGDLAALMRAVDAPRAHVVGHDWGAALAWLMAALMSRRVDHLVVLSVGHPSVFQRPSLEQREKSWYMLLYQFEGVAEELLRRYDWRLFKEMFNGQGDFDRYLVDLAKPGALTSALNWYRANRSPAAELAENPRLPLISAPTLGIWSDGDKAMVEEGMLESGVYVKNTWRYERIAGASHWIPLDAPDRVNELLLEFLGSQETEAGRPRRRY